MFRGCLLFVLGLFVVACSSAPPSATPKAAAVPTPVPTIAPKPGPTATPAGPDYAKLKWELITPLSVLIVATRDKSPRVEQRLAEFNAAAERVEPAIAGDMSFNANRLHSSIVNVRDAVARKDLATLERERQDLIELR